MAPAASSYDLFLSYNSADHRIVEEVAHKLADAGLKELFLDRWNLLIGTRWRPMLEKALGSSKAVAIFVGPGEMGSWHGRWTSHSTFRAEIRISPSYRCYSLGANLRSAFFDN